MGKDGAPWPALSSGPCPIEEGGKGREADGHLVGQQRESDENGGPGNGRILPPVSRLLPGREEEEGGEGKGCAKGGRSAGDPGDGFGVDRV